MADAAHAHPPGLTRRALALLLALGLAAWARGYATTAVQPGSATAFALGVTLLAATLAGTLFERLRLPRVSGYLVFGLACGPYGADILDGDMARELQLVNGLAVALIAFVAGLEIDAVRLRPRIGGLLRLGAAAIALPLAACFAALWAAWPWLPVAPEAEGLARLALALLLAVIVVSFSPTVTVAVIAESRARGPLSETILAVVVLADLALIVGFTLALQLVRPALGAAAGDVGFVSLVGWEIFGSFAFGGLLGAGFALYVRFVGRELTLALLGLCATLALLGTRFHFEPLLSALAAGLVLQNLAPTLGARLREAVERGSLPVLVVFFAAAGASLRLEALAALVPAVAALSVLRGVAVREACRLGSRWGGLDPVVGQRVWQGLVSQAGVTLGLALLVASEFPDWGARLQALVIGLVCVHEVIGPVLFRRALERAGEVGRADEIPEAARP